MDEQVRELEEFPGYAATSDGNIINLRTGIPRKISLNAQGFVKVSLYDASGRLTTRSVAMLVLDAFEPESKARFNSLIHLDGDRHNCAISNLMRRPRWFAMKYHDQFNHEQFHLSQPFLMLIETGEEFRSLKEPSTKYGILFSDILKSAIEGTDVYPTGYHFKFEDVV